MSDQSIKFSNGPAYEQMMGTWSAIVGERFLDWLSPARGLHWLDVDAAAGRLRS